MSVKYTILPNYDGISTLLSKTENLCRERIINTSRHVLGPVIQDKSTIEQPDLNKTPRVSINNCPLYNSHRKRLVFTCSKRENIQLLSKHRWKGKSATHSSYQKFSKKEKPVPFRSATIVRAQRCSDSDFSTGCL